MWQYMICSVVKERNRSNVNNFWEKCKRENGTATTLIWKCVSFVVIKWLIDGDARLKHWMRIEVPFLYRIFFFRIDLAMIFFISFATNGLYLLFASIYHHDWNRYDETWTRVLTIKCHCNICLKQIVCWEREKCAT